jgi:hypothetical protein
MAGSQSLSLEVMLHDDISKQNATVRVGSIVSFMDVFVLPERFSSALIRGKYSPFDPNLLMI